MHSKDLKKLSLLERKEEASPCVHVELNHSQCAFCFFFTKGNHAQPQLHCNKGIRQGSIMRQHAVSSSSAEMLQAKMAFSQALHICPSHFEHCLPFVLHSCSQCSEACCRMQIRKRRAYSRMRSDEAKAEASANQGGIPAPDIPLQPTFDAENNSYRYRYMEPPPDAALCRCLPC